MHGICLCQIEFIHIHQWKTSEVMGSRVTFDAATKSGRPSSALVPAKSLARPSMPAAVAAKLTGQRQPAPSGQAIHIALVDDDPSIHATTADSNVTLMLPRQFITHKTRC
jgi:hypothetical protein